MFTKNKNNLFGTCLFSTFKAKNGIFCSRICCYITLFIFCKIIFQKFVFFLQILSPIWLCAILCAHAILRAHCIVQYSIVQYSIVQYSIVQYSIVQYCIVQYSIVQYSIVQYSIEQYSIVQYSIVYYSKGCVKMQLFTSEVWRSWQSGRLCYTEIYRDLKELGSSPS